MDGEVAVVHLVDYEVGGASEGWTLVLTPSLGIGLGKVDDGGAFAVDAYGFGKCAWTLSLSYIEGVVVTCPVSAEVCAPTVFARTAQVEGLDWLGGLGTVVDAYLDGSGFGGGVEGKGALAGGIVELLELFLCCCCHVYQQCYGEDCISHMCMCMCVSVRFRLSCRLFAR